jgi:hypothetical protein
MKEEIQEKKSNYQIFIDTIRVIRQGDNAISTEAYFLVLDAAQKLYMAAHKEGAEMIKETYKIN